MHLTTILAPLLLAAVANAENRVFGGLGSDPCQKCLGEVEAACKGPITSSEFNNCFCVPESKAWSTLKSCITTANTECSESKESILGSYGAHCFAYKKDEDQAICVDKSQDDELLLSLADSFCSEFVTPSATPSATTTAANNTASASTSRASSSAAPTESSTATPTTDNASTTATTDVTTPAPTGSGAVSTTSSAPASTTSNLAANLSPLEFGRVGLLSLFVGVVGLLL